MKMYVRGKIEHLKTVNVEIGTGYYAEKVSFKAKSTHVFSEVAKISCIRICRFRLFFQHMIVNQI